MSAAGQLVAIARVVLQCMHGLAAPHLDTQLLQRLRGDCAAQPEQYLCCAAVRPGCLCKHQLLLQDRQAGSVSSVSQALQHAHLSVWPSNHGNQVWNLGVGGTGQSRHGTSMKGTHRLLSQVVFEAGSFLFCDLGASASACGGGRGRWGICTWQPDVLQHLSHWSYLPKTELRNP